MQKAVCFWRTFKRSLGVCLLFLGILTTGCNQGVRKTIHPQSVDGNIYLANYHVPIQVRENEYWKVPPDVRYVYGYADASYVIYYVGKDGKVYMAYKDQPSRELSGVQIPADAKLIFSINNGILCYVGTDGYVYKASVNKHLTIKDQEVPIPADAKFVYYAFENMYYVNTKGEVYNALTKQKAIDVNGKELKIPTDARFVMSMGNDPGMFYVGKDGHIYHPVTQEEIRVGRGETFIPPYAKFVFFAFGHICYSFDGKFDYAQKMADLKDGYIYEAVSQSAWGSVDEKDKKKVFVPFTTPDDMLKIFPIDKFIIVQRSDGGLYGISGNRVVIDGKALSVPTNARCITPIDFGSGVAFVDAQGYVFDVISGRRIAAVGEQGELMMEGSIKTKITNKEGKVEEIEINMSGGKPLNLPRNAKHFFGALIGGKPNFLYVQNGKLCDIMSGKPLQGTDNRTGAKYEIFVPDNVRTVFYSPNFQKNGSGFYYVHNWDGLVYDVITRQLATFDGAVAYVPHVAKEIFVNKDGVLLYTVKLPKEPEAKK